MIQLESWGRAKQTAVDLMVQFGPKVVVAALILVVGVFASRWAGRVVQRWLANVELEPPVRQLLLRVVRVLVVGLFVIMALQNLGIELLPLLAGLGLAGAGVALATQGVLSNVIAGLTIIFTKPYRVGEYIAIVGEEGLVTFISLFTTTLVHADRSRIVIPNRKIVGEILHNYGQIRQCEVRVGIAYESDLRQALALVTDLVRTHTRVLTDPAPLIQVERLEESAVRLLIRPWVAVGDYIAVPGDLNLVIVEALQRHGIAMPFPQRVVHLVGHAA